MICTCGAPIDLEACKYLGAQSRGGGGFALLWTAPCCGTAFAGEHVVDASECIACTHLVLGSEDDTKVVVPDGVLCVDCAATDPRVERHV